MTDKVAMAEKKSLFVNGGNGGPVVSGTPADELDRARDIARRYRCEFVDLNNFQLHHDLFKKIPVDLMFRYNFVPLEETSDGKLAIAIADPSQLMMIDEISLLLGKRIVTKVSTLTQISEILKKTEQSQRVLEEASEGFALDVIHDDESVADETISIDKLTAATGDARRYAKDLLDDRGLRIIAKLFVPIVLLSLAIPAAVGWAMLGGTYGRRVTVVCGRGNNGADGVVAARHLRTRGIGVDELVLAEGVASSALRRALSRADLAIDGMFGTGFRGELEGDAAIVAAALAEAGIPTLAIDIPSGVDGTTGEVRGVAVTTMSRCPSGDPGPVPPARPKSTTASKALVSSALYSGLARQFGSAARRLSKRPARSENRAAWLSSAL